MDYDRSHVVAEADAFDADEMTFVSPLPRPGSPLWAIVRPLEPYVWAAVSATFLVGVVAFVKIGRAEEKAKVVNVGLSFIRSIDHQCKISGYQAEILELGRIRQLVLLRDAPLPVRVELRRVQVGPGAQGVHRRVDPVLLPRRIGQLQGGTTGLEAEIHIRIF